tara:strand:- start:51 stop:281 length:231 start_codon:yes stop_codon:yes gene_type:complete
MTEDNGKIERLDQKTDDLQRQVAENKRDGKEHVEKAIEPIAKRVNALEGNQRWVVLGILGLVMSAAFDWILKGGGQ